MSEPSVRPLRCLTAVCALAIAAAALIPRASGAHAVRDGAFWQAIVDADHRVPAGESAVGLVDERTAI